MLRVFEFVQRSTHWYIHAVNDIPGSVQIAYVYKRRAHNAAPGPDKLSIEQFVTDESRLLMRRFIKTRMNLTVTRARLGLNLHC